MRATTPEPARPLRTICLTACLLLLAAAAGAHGLASPRQSGVTFKNSCTDAGQGLYKCVIYVEASGDVLRTIDDIRYTLPSGYSNRKHTVKRGNNASRPFSSKTFTTAENVVVNVKIDYHGRKDEYLTYRVKLTE